MLEHDKEKGIKRKTQTIKITKISIFGIAFRMLIYRMYLAKHFIGKLLDDIGYIFIMIKVSIRSINSINS